MARTGLEGLEGINLSRPEDRVWLDRQKAAGVVTSSWSPSDIRKLYRSQQFIDKYGIDKFNSMINDPRGREELYRRDIVEEAFDTRWAPYFDNDRNSLGPSSELYDINKGLGADYFKLKRTLSTDAKLELLNSNYIAPSELENKISKISAYSDITERVFSPFAGISEAMSLGKNTAETIIKNKNQAILDRIYSADLKKQTGELRPLVDRTNVELDNQHSETEIRNAFMQAINPENGPAYILSAYFNEDGTTNYSEIKDFDIAKMSEFLAKKAIYDQYLGPEAGFEALNNEATEYISKHQKFGRNISLLSRDIGISTLSYIADQWNSIRRIPLYVTDIFADANVYVTNDNQVVPTKDIHSENGQTFYEENGQRVPVHPVTMSLTALDDLGKDDNGEDRGWFNNAQFWTNAEQFGTLDEDELKMYKELGYSPHKVVYRPGEDSSIWYESAKMVSFGLADKALSLIPFGLGKIKYLSALGKGFSYAQPVISATGIGNAYGRGTFGESLAYGMQQLDQSLVGQAQEEINNLYNTDEQYKAQIDREIEQEYRNIAAAQQQQMAQSEGQMRILDREANERALRSAALQTVMARKTEEWVNNFKNSDRYGRALQGITESASSAALATSLTTSAKYVVVNYGWRKFLFRNNSELEALQRKANVRGVTKVTNPEGKSRAFFSKSGNFKTRYGQIKELGKTVGSQLWGGAWTNATDELQSAGGRRINEDRVSDIIDGLYDSDTIATTHGILDSIASLYYGALSYYEGAQAAVGSARTYEAGLVGGLGSISSIVPNLGGIIPLIHSREARKAWNKATLGEKVNTLISNGIINEYYAAKQGAMHTEDVVNYVNAMMDAADDFRGLTDAMSIQGIPDSEHTEALDFIRAVNSFYLLNKLRDDEEATEIASILPSAQRALTAASAIDKLADGSELSDREKADFVAQYYAMNPSFPRSEENSAQALQDMRRNAMELQEARGVYEDIINTLNSVRDGGKKISRDVESKLILRLAYDDFLVKRKIGANEKRINGKETINEEESSLASYGDRKHQEAHVRAIEETIERIDREIISAKNRLTGAQERAEAYTETSSKEQDIANREQLQLAVEDARLQVIHLERQRNRASLQLERFSEVVTDKDGKSKREVKVEDRVFTSHEILNMNPQDRARMLDKANYDNYSYAQQREIDTLINRLAAEDPSIFRYIEEQAYNTRTVESNREAYTMMLAHPEAAAYHLDNAYEESAKIAHNEYLDNGASMVADAIHKMVFNDSLTGPAISKQLRKVNPSLLHRLLNDSAISRNPEIEGYKDWIYSALRWQEIMSEVESVIPYQRGTSEWELLNSNLRRILDDANTSLEVLNEIGKVIEDKTISRSAKLPYIEILNSLEQIFSQKASTTSMKREDIEAAKAKFREERAREEERKRAIEEAARAETEKKAAETAAAGVTDADADTSGDRDAELAAHGLTDKDTVTNNEGTLTQEQIDRAVKEGEDVALESPTLDEQVAAAPDKVDIIPAPVDDSTDQGNMLPETSDILLGNTMYGYELDPLKYHGKQVPRQGANPNDKMSRYFAWMASAGIKLQDIIDTELSDIKKLNPDVFPMFVKYDKNATNDDAMVDFALLTVEYTQDVANIHNDKNGGVITSDGKQYLVVGTLGFARGNRAQGEMFRNILKSGQKSWFDAHPSERFFVDTRKHTKIQSITSGRLVRQLVTDSEVQIRSISELLADESRNPKGLTIGDLKWGIQYDNRLATVNVSERNVVYRPSDSVSNLGSVFLLVETANGNYIPAYIRPVRYSEINDGRLKSKIDDIFNRLTSTDLVERIKAWKELRQVVDCKKEGNWVLYGDETHNTVTVQVNGVKRPTHDLESPNFDRDKLLRELKEVDFRINITTSALSTEASLEELDEAGALTTDLAKIGTSGASYNVYAMDADGNPIITAPVENEVPTLEAGSDLIKAQRKLNSERMGNATYRKDTNGNWYTETDRLVTDPRLIEQLNYRNLIRIRDLKPNKTTGIDEIFIVNNDKDNPLVLVRRRGSHIFAMTKEGAVKTINKVNAELAEKARQERLKKELEIEASNDEAILNMSEEDRRKAADEGEDVDLGLGETLTEEQIAGQMAGNFEVEATPQQKTAEEPVEMSAAGTAEQSMVRTLEDVAPTKDEETPVVQSEPIRTGEDINKTGTKSLAELQCEKTIDTALSIIKSKKFGKRAIALLKAKFPDMPKKTAELERFLQSKEIATTGIDDVEQWLKMIEECK